jgi:glycerol-3-phosphate acyltransferase PlsX
LPPTIAIDAMGGDRAPGAVVEGAFEAARLFADTRILLVGREATVKQELDRVGWTSAQAPNLEVLHAENVIDMCDSPVEALRRKKGSSIEVATRLVRDGSAIAMVSAGNTGACVAAGTILLGLLPEVRRAGIAVTFRAGELPVVVIDMGANVSSKPEHLIQYGIMASLYAKSVLQIERPRVGLLNIGEEDEKGNPLAKTTHELFLKTRLNFCGNIEGNHLFRGVVDVVVCDGFVGNIVLKVSEGLAEHLLELFKTTVEGVFGDGRAPGDTSGTAQKLQGSFGRLRERLDYSEYGGAPLLGVNGVMIIAHGRSDARAIANAIRVARRMAQENVNKHITEEIRAVSALAQGA